MRSFVSYLLLFALATAVLAAAQDACDPLYSCRECHGQTGCKWCAGRINMGSNGMSVPLMGVCKAAATNCDTVQFGDLAEVLDLPFPMRVGPGEPWSFNVVEVPSSDPYCRPEQFNPTLASSSCYECAGRGYTWCAMDMTVLGGFVKQVGICMPSGLQPLCDSGFAPPNQWVSIEAEAYSTVEQCVSNVADAKTAPSATCEENYSCTNCGASSSACTWCGVQDVIELDYGIQWPLNLYGKCRSGASDACAAVNDINFAALQTLLPADTAEIVPIAFDNPKCHAIEWPAAMRTSTCETCVAANTDVGWCQFSQIDAVPGAPAAPSGGIGNNPGVCVDKSIAFLCEAASSDPFVGAAFYESCLSSDPRPTIIAPVIDLTTTTTESTTSTSTSSTSSVSTTSGSARSAACGSVIVALAGAAAMYAM